MNNKEFWDGVRPRIAPGTKISEIQRLYFSQILSYEDLINLPVLDAKEIRRKHNDELERQRKALDERRDKIWEEVEKRRVLDFSPDRLSGVGVSPDGVLVSVFEESEDYRSGGEIPFTSKAWDPVREIRKIRAKDPAFYAYLKTRYKWDRLFNAVEKE